MPFGCGDRGPAAPTVPQSTVVIGASRHLRAPTLIAAFDSMKTESSARAARPRFGREEFEPTASLGETDSAAKLAARIQHGHTEGEEEAYTGYEGPHHKDGMISHTPRFQPGTARSDVSSCADAALHDACGPIHLRSGMTRHGSNRSARSDTMKAEADRQGSPLASDHEQLERAAPGLTGDVATPRIRDIVLCVRRGGRPGHLAGRSGPTAATRRGHTG
jgi:hypothetical protein